MIQELMREIDRRKSAYPKMVRQGKLAEATAAHRSACLKRAIDILEGRTTRGPEKISFSKVIAEISREIKAREKYYAKWVLQGRMHPTTARRQYDLMRQIMAELCGEDLNIIKTSQPKLF